MDFLRVDESVEVLGGAAGGSSGAAGVGNVTLRILTRDSLAGFFSGPELEHIDFRQNLNNLEFAEAPLGAAFLLPLISPDSPKTASYFRGHP